MRISQVFGPPHVPVDFAAVAAQVSLRAILDGDRGPAKVIRGKPHWSCPFHSDENPSLYLFDEGKRWRCWPCGLSGDAFDYIARREGISTVEAARRFDPTLGDVQSREQRPAAPKSEPAAEPLPAPICDEALEMIEEAEARLFNPDGAKALAYLEGRGLVEPTIREARLGWTPQAVGVAWKPPGIVIPWFNGGRLALVKVRPPDAWRERFPKENRPPKYLEADRNPALVSLYPGPETIHLGHPLIIVEGELDALLVGQELAGLAAVATLGGASSRPTARILGHMLPAWPWYIATDADDAGDKAAAAWPASYRRIRPPGAFKDWTEARQGGMDLRRWWGDILAGVERPELFTWEELSTWRWGPALGDPEPGLIVPRESEAERMENATR